MDEFEKFYNKALRFLSFRPRSEKEMRDYLIRKFSLLRHSGEPRPQSGRLHNLLTDGENARDSGHGQNDKGKLILDKVIQRLKEQNFINDSEFAKWWIESRTTFKPCSLRLIKLELRQKGISDEIIDKMIYDLRFKNYDLEQAKKLIEKRVVRFRIRQLTDGMTRDEVYQKLGSYLSRRGFDWETIKQAIDESLFKRV